MKYVSPSNTYWFAAFVVVSGFLLSACVDAFVSITLDEQGSPYRMELREEWELDPLEGIVASFEEPYDTEEEILVGMFHPDRVTDERFTRLVVDGMADLTETVEEAGASLTVRRSSTDIHTVLAVTVDMTALAEEDRDRIINLGLDGTHISFETVHDPDAGTVRFEGNRLDRFTTVSGALPDLPEGVSQFLEIVFADDVGGTNGTIPDTDPNTVRWNLGSDLIVFKATTGNETGTGTVPAAPVVERERSIHVDEEGVPRRVEMREILLGGSSRSFLAEVDPGTVEGEYLLGVADAERVGEERFRAATAAMHPNVFDGAADAGAAVTVERGETGSSVWVSISVDTLGADTKPAFGVAEAVFGQGVREGFYLGENTGTVTVNLAITNIGDTGLGSAMRRVFGAENREAVRNIINVVLPYPINPESTNGRVQEDRHAVRWEPTSDMTLRAVSTPTEPPPTTVTTEPPTTTVTTEPPTTTVPRVAAEPERDRDNNGATFLLYVVVVVVAAATSGIVALWVLRRNNPDRSPSQ